MAGKNHRSSKTGRFVTESYANRHKSTTLAETRGGQPTERSRSAKTGQFVTEPFARRHPSTTVREDG